MGDTPLGITIFSDYFQISTYAANSQQCSESFIYDSKVNRYNASFSHSRRKSRTAASILKLFRLRGLTWGGDQEKVVLSGTEVASLRSEISYLEKKEAQLKAQLEHIDEILKSARLSGYMFMRTRWTALPGETPPLDDSEVDDWLPRFLVLQDSCIFLYLSSTDHSPQDSTLLSDVVEVGALPCQSRHNEESQYCFYVLTRFGLRYECSSFSKVQVDSWMAALEVECKLGSNTTAS